MVLAILVNFGYGLNREGMPGLRKTLSAKSLGHGNMGLGINGRVSTDEAVLTNDGRFVTNSATYNYTGGSLNSFSNYPFLSVGLSNYLDLSIVLPIYMDDAPVSGLSGTDQLQIGDFRYQAKFQIPYFAAKHIVDAAFVFGGNFGSAERGHGVIPREIEYFSTARNEKSSAFGYRELGIKYGLAITTDFGELAPNFQLKWHKNIGVRKTFATDVDDVLYYSLGWEYRMNGFLSAFLEFSHETRFDNLNSAKEFTTEPTTISIAPILHSPVGIDLHFGLTHAINDQGIPNVYNNSDNPAGAANYNVRANVDWEVFMGITWNGWLIPQDDDKDGIVNKRDACPDQPEDKDNFKDGDGCPDLDNDEDHIADERDACPLKPEDLDGHEDDDGCPDFDNDSDGVPDVKDGCPMIAEDPDGFEDADGCPESDNDKDGVEDANDKCPMVAEDIDGYQDEDGCPEIDNDSDGIVDAKDKCPNQPEVVNGIDDDDGCPDDKPKVKEIVNVVLRGVNFKTGSAELTFESNQVLDGVVEQLKAYPEVEIEIRGHTDNVGSEKTNQKLSEKRAQSVVNYFVSKGIAAKRMKAVGMGESKPIASNRSASGREENRRIEMYRIK